MGRAVHVFITAPGLQTFPVLPKLVESSRISAFVV